MIPLRVGALATATTLVLIGASACGGKSDGSSTTTITVYAAASLTKTFQQIGAEFEKEHHGVKVEFDFGGSSDLVTQLQQGAPADVFASADTDNMDKLTGSGLQEKDPVDFATNTLEIAVPPDNPAHITSFADLGKAGVQVVLCAPEVPCGAAALKAEQVTGVTIQPVSEEQSVTDVLGKVSSGEADAGLVYVTDVKAAGSSVTGITFPESGQVVNTYPIVSLKASKHEDLAQEFVDLVVGDTGQSILQAAGFAKP